MAKILHTADFHLDSAFTALPEEKARLRRQEARQLTDRLVELAHRAGKTAVIECVPEQTATRHIAEKEGFAYVGRTDGLEVYRLPPNE